MTQESSWAGPILAGVGLLLVAALLVVAFGRNLFVTAPVGVLEVRFVLPAGDPTGAEFHDLDGGVLLLGPAYRFELSSVTVTVDDLGDPALLIELVDDQKAGFRTLTGDHVGQKMAVLAGGWVMTAPVIEEALPGRSLIRTRADWTIERVQAALTEGYR